MGEQLRIFEYFRPTRRLCHRAGYIENFQETGEGSCPGIFFFTFFFSVFPLATSRVERMRIEAKARKSKQKNKLNPFRNTGNRPLRQSSVRGPFIFFFSVFSLVTSRVGRMRIVAKGKKCEKKVNFNPFRNSGNSPFRRTSERSWPLHFFLFFPSAFPLYTSRVGRMRIEAKGQKCEKRINYICFETREIVPCATQVSIRVQVIFFSLFFPASYFTRAKDAN